jgi:hypothetical protein
MLFDPDHLTSTRLETAKVWLRAFVESPGLDPEWVEILKDPITVKDLKDKGKTISYTPTTPGRHTIVAVVFEIPKGEKKGTFHSFRTHTFDVRS